MIRFNFFRLATRYSPQSAQSTRCTGGAAINSIVSEEERVKEDLTLRSPNFSSNMRLELELVILTN